MAKKKQSQKDFNKGFYGEIPKWHKAKDDDKPKMRKIKKKVFE